MPTTTDRYRWARGLPTVHLVDELKRAVVEFPEAATPMDRAALVAEVARRLDRPDASAPALEGAPTIAKGGRSFDFAGARWRAEGGADPDTIVWVVAAIEERLAREAGE